MMEVTEVTEVTGGSLARLANTRTVKVAALIISRTIFHWTFAFAPFLFPTNEHSTSTRITV